MPCGMIQMKVLLSFLANKYGKNLSLMKKKRSIGQVWFDRTTVIVNQSIRGAKLPTVRHVLKFDFYATQIAETMKEAFEETIKKSNRLGIWPGLGPWKWRYARKKNLTSCGKNGDIRRRARHVWMGKGGRISEELRQTWEICVISGRYHSWDIGVSDAIEQIRKTD